MQFPLTRKIVLLLVLLFAVIGLFAISSAMINSMMIRSSGRIMYSYGLGIYWDNNCNEGVSYLDWGTAEPGLTEGITIYIRNEGNTPTILYLNTTNWNPPEASNYMTLSWDYTGESIEPRQVIQVTLTLSISSNIEGITTFAFDIIISQS